MSRRYTLIVGTKNWSSWSLRAWLALHATGAPFDEITVRLRQPDTRDQIRRLVPSDRVPALRIEQEGGSFTVFDSLAICDTLAELHPEANLWPVEPAARALARSISATMHSGFASLRASLPMEFARHLQRPNLSGEVEQEISEIARFWHDALDSSGQGDGFLFGRFSIADCMYAPVVSRLRTYGIRLDPALDAYCARMFDMPVMRAWLNSAQQEVEAGLA